MRTSSFRKLFAIVMIMLSVLVVSWEYSKADAPLSVHGGEAAPIPEQSIRLRILADSDAPADQMLKREVRDAVVARINDWAAEPRTLEEAREYIRAALPELERLARSIAAEAGFDYDIKAELGVVPFPTKVYGGRLYPAGEYEALRITIGRGLGQNWWCVLFPPLCFVDVVSGEAPRTSGVMAVSAALSGAEADAPAAEPEDGGTEEAGVAAAAVVAEKEGPEVEYRFFLLEVIASALETIRGWLA